MHVGQKYGTMLHDKAKAVPRKLAGKGNDFHDDIHGVTVCFHVSANDTVLLYANVA